MCRSHDSPLAVAAHAFVARPRFPSRNEQSGPLIWLHAAVPAHVDERDTDARLHRQGSGHRARSMLDTASPPGMSDGANASALVIENWMARRELQT